MQTATKSDQNIVLAASQETGRNYRSRTITYHRDGTVTLWDVFSQAWVRTANPSDQLLGGLPLAEIDRIQRLFPEAAGHRCAFGRIRGIVDQDVEATILRLHAGE